MPSKKELNREASRKMMSSEDTMTEQFQVKSLEVFRIHGYIYDHDLLILSFDI
jgi:hypothetical protein